MYMANNLALKSIISQNLNNVGRIRLKYNYYDIVFHSNNDELNNVHKNRVGDINICMFYLDICI